MKREKRGDEQKGKTVSSVRIHERERERGDARLICVVCDTKIWKMKNRTYGTTPFWLIPPIFLFLFHDSRSNINMLPSPSLFL